MKHLKTFESFNEPVNEELLGFGKKDKKSKKGSAYKRTIEFLKGDSDEAKKIKEIYKEKFEGKSDSDIQKDRSLLGFMKQITRLGAKWAKDNKMDAADYTFKQIQTVMREDFDRPFRGGADHTIGESYNQDMINYLTENLDFNRRDLESLNEGLIDWFVKIVNNMDKGGRAKDFISEMPSKIKTLKRIKGDKGLKSEPTPEEMSAIIKMADKDGYLGKLSVKDGKLAYIKASDIKTSGWKSTHG